MGPQLLRVVPAHIFIHSAMTGVRLGVPLVALQHGHSVASIGVLISLFFLSQVCFALPAGKYADRHGMWHPMTAAMLLSAIGSIVAALFPSFSFLCIAAFCTGGATGISSITLQRHVGRAAGNATELKQVFSWLAIGPAIANFLGPLVAGLLIDNVASQAQSILSFRITFAAFAIFPIFSWLALRGVVEPPLQVRAVSAVTHHPLELLGDAMFRRLLFINLLQQATWDVHAFVVPLLGHERGFPATVIGSILAAFAIATAAVRIALPFFAARMSELRLILGSILITSALLVAYPLLTASWAMATCSACLGAALGAVQPMVMSMLHQTTPEGRHGEALALRLMAVNSSSVVLPLIFGMLGGAIGIAGVLWITGAMVLSGTVVLHKLQSR